MFYFSKIEIKYCISPVHLALRQGLSAAFYDVSGTPFGEAIWLQSLCFISAHQGVITLAKLFVIWINAPDTHLPCSTPAIFKDNKQLRKIQTILQQNVFFSTKMVHTDDQTPVTTVMRQGRRYQKIENNLF